MTDRIPMADLAAEHAPIQDELLRAAARVLASHRFILGAEVAAFERELAVALAVKQAVGVSSGSDALLTMLMACGIGPGDEVVTTAFSFFATVEAILRLGARPVFADIDPLTLNIDPGQVTKRIGPRTRAVLAVHLFGRMARMSPLRALCSDAKIPLLEDAAQAAGARQTEGDCVVSPGRFGLGAALSFFPTKNLGGFGDGGMVLTDDDDFAKRIVRIRSHGATNKVRHDVVGGNFRLDEMQAALLRVKLPGMAARVAARRKVAKAYHERLARLPIILPAAEDGCAWNQFVVRVPADRREALVRHLDDKGVASAIYYSIPIHLQPALAALGHGAGELPVTERISKEVLALPMFPDLPAHAVERVAEAIADFFG